MFISQNNECAICSKKITEECARIDHCHESGQVRGLLCNQCNLSLGHIEKYLNNTILLKNIIAYLERSIEVRNRNLTITNWRHH